MIDKRNANVTIAFDETSISYMKSLLTAQSAASSGSEKVMIDELLTQLEGQVKVTFGKALWDSL